MIWADVFPKDEWAETMRLLKRIHIKALRYAVWLWVAIEGQRIFATNESKRSRICRGYDPSWSRYAARNGAGYADFLK
ncbi:hypothetical protein [Aquamicrobium sp. LC103]|uniref:hypothetical protein n=1 Tax=Aquamicrobium sp. LC103 TaxID=1120658 RepID=UPI000AD8A9DB|nr:hypothetical protein [Aquamicrobium sp. LC103]TKT75669.1 hypothetical protein XW59_017580 [Aquamicrobium sp. LC103]